MVNALLVVPVDIGNTIEHKFLEVSLNHEHCPHEIREHLNATNIYTAGQPAKGHIAFAGRAINAFDLTLYSWQPSQHLSGSILVCGYESIQGGSLAVDASIDSGFIEKTILEVHYRQTMEKG